MPRFILRRSIPARPVCLLVGASLLVPVLRAPWAAAETVPVAAGAAAGTPTSAVRVAAGPGETTAATSSTTTVPGSAGVTARVLPVPATVSTPTTGGRVTSTGTGPVRVAATVPPRYGDPLADLAKGALDAFVEQFTSRGQADADLAPPVSTDGSSTDSWAPRVTDQSWVAVPVDGIVVGTMVQTRVAPSVQAALAVMPNDPRGRYAASIRQLARQAADRGKVDATRLEQVWLRTDPRRMWAVLAALSQVGTQYRWAGNQPGGFDCSGLTSWAWAQAGVRIPRTSGEQISAVAPRSFDQIQPGDLLWRPGHIAMYLGLGDAMIDAPRTGKPVEVKRMGTMTRFGSPL